MSDKVLYQRKVAPTAIYTVEGVAMDTATGRLAIIYSTPVGVVYVTDKTEFMDKFEVVRDEKADPTRVE